MPSILFVCTANRFRSPIAAAWFSKNLQNAADASDWHVNSAGTWADPDQLVFPSVNWIKNHLDLDLSLHRSACVEYKMLTQYDLILVMENNHQEALLAEFPDLKKNIFLLTQVTTGVGYDIPDPALSREDIFLATAHKVTSLIDKGYNEICLLAHKIHSGNLT